MIVHSKVGLTPWQFRAKVNPALQNYSLGKGFRLAQAGIMNFNFDYAKAWGDPRMKTRSYGRYTFNVGHGYNLSKQWHIDTKLRLFYANDWSGKDPDAINDGTENNNKNYSFNLTHNGRISMNRPLMRTLSYTLGGSFSQVNSKNTRIVPVSSGLLPILTAEETGYHAVPWTTSSYLATGNTRSSPANFFAKLNDSFFFNAGKTNQSFKMGVDYRVSWNALIPPTAMVGHVLSRPIRRCISFLSMPKTTLRGTLRNSISSVPMWVCVSRRSNPLHMCLQPHSHLGSISCIERQNG